MDIWRQRHWRASERNGCESEGSAGDGSIAIVGLACRFPDADDAAGLFEVITTGRRAFRRIPPGRLDQASADVSHRTRAALLEGWRWDPAAFGVEPGGDVSADPARWLALETAARALAGSGFPGGAGLPERTGAFIGSPGPIAAAVCAQLGLNGGGFDVGAGGASSLVAVTSACSALASGELDFAVAGGVDLSLDPLGPPGPLGPAESGLASDDMRIYDANPTGCLPGEGCGMVLLMRTADAIDGNLPICARILGWGLESAGQQRRTGTDPGRMLLALRRAYAAARIDPLDVELIEGCGTGVASADEAELTALAMLRTGAKREASLGALTANIGHCGAAAGVAGLAKTVLAIANGVLPPSTGIGEPHRLLRDEDARLRARNLPEPWPEGPRYAGVSAGDCDGMGVHLVLSGQPETAARPPGGRGADPGGRPRGTPRRRGAARARTVPGGSPVGRRVLEGPFAFLVHGPDLTRLTAVLSRIAEIAAWLSDSELGDLACQLASEAANPGSARVAIIATRPEQLARLASEAITMVPTLTAGQVHKRPGIFAADHANGRVTLLLAGRRARKSEPRPQLDRALATLRWLDELGVQPTAAVGHGVGELVGLVWAGCVSPAQASALSSLRSGVLAASVTSAPGSLSAAIDEFAALEFQPPRRRLISGCTGTEIRTAEDIPGLLTAELLDARSAGKEAVAAERRAGRLAKAVLAGAADADLLLLTAPNRDVTAAVGQFGAGESPAGRRRHVTTVSIDAGLADARCMARTAGALFAAGALTRPELLYSPLAARPFDIWRDQVFIDPALVREPGGRPVSAAPAPPTAAEPVPGNASSHRCYVERTIEPTEPVAAQANRPWRIYSGGCEPFSGSEADLVRHEPSADRTLAILGRLNEAGTLEAALLAAQDAISTGELVAISPDAGLTGFWASLHAEHPQVGVTAVRRPPEGDGLRAACQIAAEPGRYRELAIDVDGSVRELVMTPAELNTARQFPFGPGDVVLISRGAGAAGLALAQVLACSGAAIAIVGRDHPRSDDAVIATLEQLRQAGVAVGYEIVNPASASALDAAVRRIARRFGPVTAVAHAVAATPTRGIGGLVPADLHSHVAAQAGLLRQLVTAARGKSDDGPAGPGQLRFIATFGSLIGRYGLAGEGLTALASAAVADQAERLAAASPGCRAVHVDWPAWSGADLGERPDLAQRMGKAGFTPLPVAEGSRLLLRLLAMSDLPSRFVVHDRPIAVRAEVPDRVPDRATRTRLPRPRRPQPASVGSR